MLSIGAMGKADAGTGNYYVALAQEDYYTAGGEPPGQWRGAGAGALGLAAQIEAGALKRVLGGFEPHQGEALVRNAGPEHLSGWDLTFSAPKSVSVLWSQADPQTRQAIQAAQQAAVDRTIQFVQAHAACTRTGPQGAVQEPVAGLVVATFEHSTSREQDPQLHTHCLVANLALRQDGSWGTLDSRHLYRWKMAIGALYRAELAQQLRERLELGISRDGRSFRIQGVPRAVEEHFSKRSGQIQEHLHRRGLTGAAAAAVAALDSREKKDRVDRPALFERWQREGQALGFGREAVRQFLDAPPAAEPIEPPTPEAILDQLTQTASTFTERAIWRATAEASPGAGGYDAVAERVRQTLTSPERVPLGIDDKGSERYSTRAMVELEKRMVQAAVERQGEGRHTVQDAHVAAVLSTYTLSAEQADAVRHLTQGTGGVACVVGMAGTGKSYALDAARAAWERAGFRVTGAALSGKAAQGLQESAHIPSETLHALLARLDQGEGAVGNKDILVLDEAGMVGSRQMQRLLAHAQRAGAKVALVGDPRQLQPVDAGGAFRALVERLGAPMLTDIRRQREDWARTAVHDLANGKAVQALVAYATRGLLTLADDRAGAIERVAQDWLAFQNSHPTHSAIMLASTREESRHLNEAARGLLKSQDQLTVAVTVNTAQGRREFAEGDRVLFTRNSRLQGVRNGSLGTVERIKAEGPGQALLHVRLDDGRLTSLHTRHYHHLEHGYALTTHKAQGVTVDQAYVLTGGPMTDRELSYVQMSRHRDRARIYADRAGIEELLREATPTEGMVAYAESLAEQKGVPLPEGYKTHFLACRDFLNEHATRHIDTQKAPPQIQALARPMTVSRAKDTTQDYERPTEREMRRELER